MTTTRAMLDLVIERRMASIAEINRTKGREYASDADALANLRPHAELGITGLQRWGIYFEKHVRSILSYCGRGETLSEPIESRIDDAILYLLLLAALVEEGQRDLLDRALRGGDDEPPAEPEPHFETVDAAERDTGECRCGGPWPCPDADGGPAGEAAAAAFLAAGGRPVGADADGRS